MTHFCFCFVRGPKINADFFCTKFFGNSSGHGRPCRKSWTSAPKIGFSCGPGDGENFLTPAHPGVRVGNVRRKFGPKSLCLCCIFFSEFGGPRCDYCSQSFLYGVVMTPNGEFRLLQIWLGCRQPARNCMATPSVLFTLCLGFAGRPRLHILCWGPVAVC